MLVARKLRVKYLYVLAILKLLTCPTPVSKRLLDMLTLLLLFTRVICYVIQ